MSVLHFSDRPHLLTVLVHGDYTDVVGVASLSQEMGDDLLLLHTACKGIPLQQLPRKRCGYKTGHAYSYPEALLVSVCLFGKACKLLS